MSKYTKEEQIKIIGWAMNLEAAIQSEKAQLSSLKNMRFKAMPEPPSSPKTIQPDYPKAPKASFSNYLKDNSSKTSKLLSKQNIIKLAIIFIVLEIIGSILSSISTSAIGTIGFIISTITWFFVPAIGGLYIKEYFEFLKKRKELSNKLAQNTPEYVEAYNKAEKTAKEKQEALDLQYAKDKEKYETQIVPMYNQELATWEASQEMKINIITDDLTANLNAQENLYNETKLVPKNNRSLNDLIWIYDDMSTSEHDFERAIDMLNANKQLAQSQQIESAIHNMNNDMQNSLSAVYYAIERGNDIAEEVSRNLGKTRRDMNIGNIVATAQRHKYK